MKPYLCRFQSLAPALTPAELSLYGKDKGIWDETLDCLFYELDATLNENYRPLATGLERARELAQRTVEQREIEAPRVVPVAVPLFEEEAA